MQKQERTRQPAHPGRILRNLYLEPLELSVTKFSETLGVSRKAISQIVNEHKSLTPEMAVRLSQAFPNTSAQFWLNLQNNYDLWRIQQEKAWQPIPAIFNSTLENIAV